MVHEFGPFRYDSEQRVLFRDGQPVALAPKALETLHVLVERRGRIVEKAELMKLVWPDAVVEEIGLARNISLLRKALEADYIETIPKRGYRFVAAAEPAPPARRRWPAIAAAAALVAAFVYWQFYMPSRFVARHPGPSLAVVPFGPEGFDDLLVAEFQGMNVVSPGTVDRYQRARLSPAFMGRVLGLDVLLEGTVQTVGDRTRVVARLVDVHSGRVAWSGTFEGTGDWQPQMAREIATAARKSLR